MDGMGGNKHAMPAKNATVCQLYLKGQCGKTAKDCPLGHPPGWEGSMLKDNNKQPGKGKGKEKRG